MKLHRLPNGNWINPSDITAIRINDPITVAVHLGERIEIIACITFKAAAMADEIANAVNAWDALTATKTTQAAWDAIKPTKTN